MNITHAKRDDVYYAEIWMGTLWTHVGTLRRKRLYNRLYDCFPSVCKISEGHVLCLNGDLQNDQIPSCKIPNIVQERNQDGVYDSNGNLTISYRVVKHSPKKVDLDLTTVWALIPNLERGLISSADILKV